MVGTRLLNCRHSDRCSLQTRTDSRGRSRCCFSFTTTFRFGSGTLFTCSLDFSWFDGIVPEASWFPVVWRLKTTDLLFRARGRGSAIHLQPGPDRKLIVQLPTGTLKRVTVPVFANRGDSSWDVRLLDDRGKTRSEQLGVRARKQVSAGRLVFGAITRQAQSTPVLKPGTRRFR